MEQLSGRSGPYKKRVQARLDKWTPMKRYIVGFATVVILTIGVGFLIQFYVDNTVEVPKRGGAYREAVVGLPRFVNPVLAQSNDIDRDLVRLIYPSLLSYDNAGTLIPSLASSYEVQSAGTEYVFTLREDAEWEDGTPITSADVAFTIRLIQDPKYSSPLRQNWIGVTVETEGEYTVRFLLSSPYIPFPENVTIGILPKHIWENIAPQSFPLADANLRPISGGPYAFLKFQKDTSGYIISYSLTRNDNYFGDGPFLDSITFRFFEDEEGAINAYNRKLVDGIAGKFEVRRQTIVHSFTMPRYFALFFNESRTPPLSTKTMREALRFATDKEAIVRDVLGGEGEVVNSPIPSFMDAFNPEAISYEFDPERAKELLTKQGWIDEDGDGIREKGVREDATPLELSLATVDWPELRQVAEHLQAQWLEVGIRLNIDFYPIGELQQNIIRPREYQILLFGEVLSINPDPFSFWHSSQKKDPGLNLSLYENKTVDRLLEEARQERDELERTKKLRQFQKEVLDDVAAIFLYNPTYLYGVNKNIKGIDAGIIADPSWRFGEVNQWFIETKRIWK